MGCQRILGSGFNGLAVNGFRERIERMDWERISCQRISGADLTDGLERMGWPFGTSQHRPARPPGYRRGGHQIPRVALPQEAEGLAYPRLP